MDDQLERPPFRPLNRHPWRPSTWLSRGEHASRRPLVAAGGPAPAEAAAPPHRRWFTRNVLAAVALLVVVAVAALAGWWNGDARGTSLHIVGPAATAPAAMDAYPKSLVELHRLPSPLTARSGPIVIAGVVATGTAHTVTGWSPASADEVWSYHRDRPLCGLTAAWSSVVAVFRGDAGCGQVTAIEADTGNRLFTRSSEADPDVRIDTDGKHVISFGSSRLEAWRSDLVRTVEYGRVSAAVEPGSQVKPIAEGKPVPVGCTLIDAAAMEATLAVLEQCPREAGARLTLQHTVPEDNRIPERVASIELATADSRIIASTANTVSVFEGGQSAQVTTYLADGSLLNSRRVASPPASPDARISPRGAVNTWWDGQDLEILAAETQVPVALVPNAIGPATLWAGHLLVPTRTGLDMVNPQTGGIAYTYEFDRSGYSGPVRVATWGELVLEQRGDDVVILGQPAAAN